MGLEKLQTIKKFSSIREILNNRDLAKLGDIFINFIYSLAKSCVLERFDAWKVPDKVLAQALRDAEMRGMVSTRANAHNLGDSVEALIIHEWIFRHKSIGELTSLLVENLKDGNFSDRKKEARSASQAFTAVLLEIRKRFTE